VQTVKSTKKYSDSLELSYNSYCTLPNSNRTVPISNILLIFLLNFIGSIRCTVPSYNHIKLKINFYFLRFPKKILFIVFLKKTYFLKVRWFNSRKNSFVRFDCEFDPTIKQYEIG
jgi:hypothetical protein